MFAYEALLKNSFLDPDGIGIWLLRSLGKTGEPGEKPLGARERTNNNKINPHAEKHAASKWVMTSLRYYDNPI